MLDGRLWVLICVLGGGVLDLGFVASGQFMMDAKSTVCWSLCVL